MGWHRALGFVVRIAQCTLRSRRTSRSSWLLGLLSSTCVVSHVHAGPNELFWGALQIDGKPEQIIAPYVYGGGGLFVSSDAGKSFGLMCSSAADPNLQTTTPERLVFASGTGAVYIGIYDGLWQGDANGCGFVTVPELSGRRVADLQGDPLDPRRTYVATATGDGAQDNGLSVNDGTSAAFVPFGEQGTTWIESLRVVKNGSGRRIYETGVTSVQITDPATGLPADDVHYYVRVSDDDAVTFSQYEYDLDQFGPTSASARFRIVAVDPQNAEHVFAVVRRDVNDLLVYSPQQGKAGTWVMLTEVGDLEAIEFAPDGKLYFGDYAQASPSLFVVDEPGDMPRLLTNTWKVGCLHYDSVGRRMLACHDWQLGTADLTSGAFSPIFDMRCADRFVECPGQASMQAACALQLSTAYCGTGHYAAAPLCGGYTVEGVSASFIAELDYTCNGSAVVPKIAGASGAGMAGTAGTNAAGISGTGTPSAGTGAANGGNTGAVAAGASGPMPATAKGGCDVASVGAGARPTATFVLSGLSLVLARRRRPLAKGVTGRRWRPGNASRKPSSITTA
jgi:hypothetical protein